jgi:hypothetical protein
VSAPRPASHVAWEVLPDGSLMVCHLPTGAMLELSAPAGRLWTALVEGTPDPEAADFYALLRERDLIV